MKEETLWEHTEGMYEADLRRVEADGKTFWSLGTKELHTNYGGQAEVDLNREALEKLFRAIEAELYPERAGVSFKRPPEEILNTFWEFVPTHCPVCGERLKKAQLGDWYCTSYHGKTYTVCVQGKTMWKWFLIKDLPQPFKLEKNEEPKERKAPWVRYEAG